MKVSKKEKKKLYICINFNFGLLYLKAIHFIISY